MLNSCHIMGSQNCTPKTSCEKRPDITLSQPFLRVIKLNFNLSANVVEFINHEAPIQISSEAPMVSREMLIAFTPPSSKRSSLRSSTMPTYEGCVGKRSTQFAQYLSPLVVIAIVSNPSFRRGWMSSSKSRKSLRTLERPPKKDYGLVHAVLKTRVPWVLHR